MERCWDFTEKLVNQLMTQMQKWWNCLLSHLLGPKTTTTKQVCPNADMQLADSRELSTQPLVGRLDPDCLVASKCGQMVGTLKLSCVVDDCKWKIATKQNAGVNKKGGEKQTSNSIKSEDSPPKVLFQKCATWAEQISHAVTRKS